MKTSYSKHVTFILSKFNINLASFCTVAILAFFTAFPSWLSAQQEICDQTVTYTGTFEDFQIPDDIISLSITAKGGDGGFGRVATFLCTPFGDTFLNDCKGNGGLGANVTATFPVGNDVDQIPPGSMIRTVVGGQGQSRNVNVCDGTSYEFGGGGGGSGVLYLAPGSEEWEILLVAGAGGGGYTQMLAGICADQSSGGGGGSGTSGGSGSGSTSGSGGSSGGGGQLGGINPYPGGLSGGGGGAFGDGGGSQVPLLCGFDLTTIGEGIAGFPAGGAGGNYDGCGSAVYDFMAVGGYGFGGGGAGFGGVGQGAGGGGGGGYSGGGGGGITGTGGGGGSYVSPMATSQTITPGGSTPNPANGFVSITCAGTLFADCPADVTLNTDPGEAFATLTLTPPTAIDECNVLGNALNFDGVDDRVSVSNPVGSVFTIEAWIKTAATSLTGTFAYDGNGIVWSDVAFDANDFTLAILNDKLSFFDGAGSVVTNGTTILNDDVWHHIAVVRNGLSGATSLYVDGAFEISNACNNVALNANPEIMIGGNPFGGHFEGSIDEVRIWSEARTEIQIQNSISCELSAQPGLQASYPFSEGLANEDNAGIITASDASGNGNNGTLSNFALTGATSNWVDGNPWSTIVNDAPETLPIGNTTVTWTITDAEGNSSTCGQNITVIDNEAPEITCQEDLVVTPDPGEIFATTAIPQPTAIDNSSLGNALNFDGVNDGIFLTTAGLPVGNSSRTLEARIRTTQVFAAIVSFGGFGVNERFALYVLGGALHFVGEGNDYNSGVPVNDGAWHHVAATYETGSLKLYVDGDLVLTQETTFNTALSQFSMGYKSTPFPVEYYQGDLEEVRVWNIARTQNEISSNKSSELVLPQTGLVSYFKFNQGIPGGDNPSETILTDELSANFGELSNFALTGLSSNWVDNSGIILTNDAPATFPIGTTTVTWTATDPSGNSATCEQTVTVEDPACLDCAGVCNGSAFLDNCGDCVGGNTGEEPCCASPFPAVDESSLTTVVNPFNVMMGWEPVFGQIGCVIQVRFVDANILGARIVIGESANSTTIPNLFLEPATDYEWRVRCGCSQTPLIAGPPSSWQPFSTSAGVSITASPNPVTDHTTVTITSEINDNAVVSVFDLNGRQVSELYFGDIRAMQSYRLDFDASGLPNGVYLCRYTGQYETFVTKIMVAR